MPEAVTRKLGPLPVWAWAIIVAGTFFAVRLLRGGNGQQDATVQMIPTGAPDIQPSQGFLQDLTLRLDEMERNLSGTPSASVTPPPSTTEPDLPGFNVKNYILGLRNRFPDLRTRFRKRYGKLPKGATDKDRRAYYRRELAFYAGARPNAGILPMENGEIVYPAISAKP